MTDYKKLAIEIIAAKTAFAIEGGGALGVGEVGALSRWVELGGDLSKITHIVGASVGSIIATAIANGADIEFMKKTLFGLNLGQFEDNSYGLIRDLARLIKKYGWNKGHTITDWAGSLLCQLCGDSEVTMAEQYERTGVKLTTNGCSLRFKDTFYMNHETEPNTKQKDSIRMSSSIPIFYAAIFRNTEQALHANKTQHTNRLWIVLLMVVQWIIIRYMFCMSKTCIRLKYWGLNYVVLLTWLFMHLSEKVSGMIMER